MQFLLSYLCHFQTFPRTSCGVTRFILLTDNTVQSKRYIDMASNNQGWKTEKKIFTILSEPSRILSRSNYRVFTIDIYDYPDLLLPRFGMNQDASLLWEKLKPFTLYCYTSKRTNLVLPIVPQSTQSMLQFSQAFMWFSKNIIFHSCL